MKQTDAFGVRLPASVRQTDFEPWMVMEDAAKPDRARDSHNAGRALLQAGDIDAAITQLELAVATYPHFKSLELLGEAWLRKGEPLRALVPLAAATTLNGQVRAPSLLAEALLAAGEAIDAHRIAELALTRDPKNRKAREVLESTQADYERWQKGHS
jgi:tetratricopeptide (TPR) repeat protein